MNKEQAIERIIENKQWRKGLDAVLQEMKKAQKEGKASRNRSLSITHLEDSIMRLGMDMKDINEEVPGIQENPYPQSYNPENAKVEPTADGLKL